MVADELRRQADEFVDLANLMPRIGRDADRPERVERTTRYADRRAAQLLQNAGNASADDAD